MVKYELVKKEKEVSWKKRYTIAEGCTMGEEPELIKSFDSLEEALDALKKEKTYVRRMSSNETYYLVTEYSVEKNEYDDDGEWTSGGDVFGFSKMEIKVIKKDGFDTIKVCDSLEEAEKVWEKYDGESYISI